MTLLTRYLKLAALFAIVLGILIFVENNSSKGQQQPQFPSGIIIRPTDRFLGQSRPFMPPPSQVQALQNGGSQFGFNGITSGTANNFQGNQTGIGGGISGGISGIGGGISGISGGLSGLGGGLSGIGGGLSGLGGGLGGLGGGLGGLGGGLGGIGGIGGLGGKGGLVGNGANGQ